jgi:hypothetical protein
MTTETITLILLWVHVPFAIAWIGIAMLDAFLAITPGLLPRQRAALIRSTLPIVLVAIPVIILTGIWQTVYNPLTRPQWSLALLDDLRRTTYGQALFYKHVFVVGTLLATLAIKLVLIRRLEATIAQPVAVGAGGGDVAPVGQDSGEPRLLRTVAWINVLFCLAIIMCVVLMVWQLH